MATYLVLIYGDEQRWTDATEQWHAANGERHGAFDQAAGAAVLRGGALERSATATSLRPAPGGGVISTDGPFVETKEAIGGFYLLEAADDAEALRLAAMIPEATTESSGVEVRRAYLGGG